MSRGRPSSLWPVVFGFVTLLSIGGAYWLYVQTNDSVPAPKRISNMQTMVEPKLASGSIPDAMSRTTPPPTPVGIKGSDILRVSVPAVGINLRVSGETLPRKTVHCHGSDMCIDPPVPDQAAWYGDVPSMPGKGTVRLFGHTSWTIPAYAAFNNLVVVAAGDKIVVTTETGTFTYRADTPRLIPYTNVVQSQLIWGNSPNRLVLVTCNSARKSGTVIQAWLINAIPR